MHLPQIAKSVLKNNTKFCYSDDFIVTDKDVDWFQKNLGIKNPDSSFISYYTIVAFPPIGNGAELLPLESIIENAKLDIEESPEGIGKRFVRFTSYEGERAYFFDVETDKVFDIQWGQEKEMIENLIPEVSNSFYEFLQKYYEKT